MYFEWASLEQEIQGEFSTSSVLHKFPEVVGRDVAGAVVKNLAQSLSHGASTGQPSALVTDREVQWTMEVSDLRLSDLLLHVINIPLSASLCPFQEIVALST